MLAIHMDNAKPLGSMKKLKLNKLVEQKQKGIKDKLKSKVIWKQKQTNVLTRPMRANSAGSTAKPKKSNGYMPKDTSPTRNSSTAPSASL